jgi:hypothetical protein
MSLGTILLIVLILMLVGVLPTWPHARTWGYGPSEFSASRVGDRYRPAADGTSLIPR